MVDIEPSRRIILQCDWNQILREKDGKAWVTFRKSGVAGVHGELRTQALSAGGEPYVTASPDAFSVNSIQGRSVTVSYTEDGASRTVCRFLAPQATLYSVHDAKKSVTCLDVSAGGLAVSCDRDGHLRLWTTNNGEIRRELSGHLGDVYTCQFFPSGVVVLSGGSDTQIKVWSVETGQCAATITGHQAGVTDLAVVERGRNVVSVSRDGTVRLWDVGQSQAIHCWEELGLGIINACYLQQVSADLGQPDTPTGEREVLTEGKMLLVGGELGALAGYGLHSRKQIFSYQCDDAVNCCTFLSDTTACCGTQSGNLYFFDVRNTSVPMKVKSEGRSAILSMCPRMQGCYVSTGDGSCFYVDESRESSLELTGPDCDPVYTVAHDGEAVYTGCRDGAIRKYGNL